MRSLTHFRALSHGYGSGSNRSVALRVALLHAHDSASELAHKDDEPQTTVHSRGEYDSSVAPASRGGDGRHEGSFGAGSYGRAAMASVHLMRRFRAQYTASCHAHAVAGTLSPLALGASGHAQPATCFASLTTVLTRAARAEDFDGLLHRFCERGYVDYDKLLGHPDCPAPAVLLERVLHLCTPSVAFTERILCAVLAPPSFVVGHSAEAAYALERVAALLRQDGDAAGTASNAQDGWRAHELRVWLYEQPSVRCLLLEALLSEGLYGEVVRTLRDMPDAWMTARLWSALTQAAAQSKLPDSELLWRLLALARAARPLRRTGAGESGLLGSRRRHAAALMLPSATITAAASESEDVAECEWAAEQEPPLQSYFDVRAGSVVVTAEAAPPPPRDGPDAGVAELMTAEELTATAYHACAMNQNEIAYAREHRGGPQGRGLHHAPPSRRALAHGGIEDEQNVDQECRESDGVVVRLFGTTEECVTAVTSATPALSAEAREQIRACAHALQLRAVGVAFGLNAATATALMLRPGFSFGGQCTPLLALHILRRYVRTCHALGEEARRLHDEIAAEVRCSGAAQQRGVLPALAEAGRAGTPGASAHTTPKDSTVVLQALRSAATPHPSPFFVMLQILRDSRDVRPPLEQGVLRLTAQDATSHEIDREGGSHGITSGQSGSTNNSRDTGDSNSSSSSKSSKDCSSSGGEARGGQEKGRDQVVLHYLRRGLLPMMHWELAWSTFQQLNRESPRWYTVIPADAGELCMNVIEVLCRGADPWLTLNVARSAAARHIVDGLDITLWLLNRLDPSHHTDEARAVARRLFRWLLADIGVHLQPRLHHQLIPAARVLIRLGLYDELRVFYNTVLDNLFNFTETFRHAFMLLLADLLCPACCAMLPEHNFYMDRTCPYCLTLVPAKDASHVASFQLSAEHMQRIRERRRAHRLHARQRLSASLQDMDDHEGGLCARPPLRGPPPDAAQVLARALQREPAGTTPQQLSLPLLLPGVHYEGGVSLFPLQSAGDAAGKPPAASSTTAGQAPSGAVTPDGSVTQTAAVLDLRSAMEESSRRLELQRAARQYALAQRGVDLSDLHAALPTSLSSLAEALVPRGGGQLDAAAQLDSAGGGGGTTLLDGAAGSRWRQAAGSSLWTCVWCQEQNKSWLSRVQCMACGAETGPDAPWRRFVYVTSPHDVMGEIRARMMNAQGRPADALVAAYLLMLYRRTFLLRATPHDQVRVQQLVLRLCDLQERVLAAYVYTRLVPPPLRAQNRTLYALATLFGADTAAVAALTPAQLHGHDEEDDTGATQGASADATFFATVFTPQTCKVCFANHDWHLCPIVTRDFASATAHAASPTLSPQEKQRTLLEHLLRLVTAALEHGKQNTRLVVEAYAAFVRSPFRELFAEVHANETNRLSLLLSAFKQYRRAAFVLCHIPLHARWNEAYCKLVPYFDVSEEDAMRLLRHRHVGDGIDEGHPNFVQVAMTCCVCLGERHASFACSRLTQWLEAVNELVRAGADLAAGSGPTRRTVDRLRAQVQGWTSAGPERLHAFYRFLLQQLPALRAVSSPGGLDDDGGTAFAPDSLASAQPVVTRRRTLDDPLIYALNVTLCKLAATGRTSYAYRLYAHSPMDCLTRRSTAALLRLNRFSEASVEALLQPEDDKADVVADSAAGLNARRGSQHGSGTDAKEGHNDDGDDHHHQQRTTTSVAEETLAVPPPAARRAAVPMRTRCLLCFEADHAFFDCPELAAQSATAGKLAHVLRHLVGITCTQDGVTAAAAYVYWCYNRGQLSNELLREERGVCMAMLHLVRRCFAARQLALGVRVLRCLPIELVPPEPTYLELWRAAGLDEATVEARRVELLALLDAEDIHPVSTATDVGITGPRRTYSARFISNLHHCLHDQLCRHCYESGHSVATCSLFHSEVSFGRDYVAAYRMSMMSEQLEREWQDAYLLKLVLFFQAHQAFMPYHIAGVASALNAIAAMWSFRGEPGIALRHLLNIPPAYRRRQAFKHILHSLHVPTAEIARVLAGFYFSPDDANGNSGSSSGGGVTAQHLLLPKPPIRDVALRAVFEKFPAAMTALEQSEQRMLQIMQRHADHSASAPAKHSDVTTALTEPAGEAGKASPAADSDVAQEGTGFAVRAAAIGPVWRTLLLCKMQSGGINELREDFDPILSELEDAVGMKLGSRHVLFTTAMDVLGSVNEAGRQTAAQTTMASSGAAHECPEATITTSLPPAQPGAQKATVGAAHSAVTPPRDVAVHTTGATRQQRQGTPDTMAALAAVHPKAGATTTRGGRQARRRHYVDLSSGSRQRGGVSTSFAPLPNAAVRGGRQRRPSSGWQSSGK